MGRDDDELRAPLIVSISGDREWTTVFFSLSSANRFYNTSNLGSSCMEEKEEEKEACRWF